VNLSFNIDSSSMKAMHLVKSEAILIFTGMLQKNQIGIRGPARFASG